MEFSHVKGGLGLCLSSSSPPQSSLLNPTRLLSSMASSSTFTNQETKSVVANHNNNSSPFFITSDTLQSILSYPALIDHLHLSLPAASTTISSPARQNYAVSPSSSLLLMPSWSSSPSLPYIGVKLVTYFPENSLLNLPGVHASYELFSSLTGQSLASMDGTTLTLYRTACVSGLASKLLARIDSQVLVMIGAGALAPHLIKAHLSAVPSLRKVVIWNRNPEKGRKLAEKMQENSRFSGIVFESNESLEDATAMGDIVSSATNSEVPLVKGEKLKAGAHLDMVGSFKPSMRECDDLAIKRGRVFVDNEAALEEAGELVGAFERGVSGKEEIGGDLIELIRGQKVGRTSVEEITVFKSVGSAVVDFLAAQFVYETYLSSSFPA